MSTAKSYTKYIEWAVMLILLMGLLYWTRSLDFVKDLKPESGREKVLFIASLIPAGFLVLAIHELGHLIAGLAQGFRLSLYVVGPLGIRRGADDKVEIYLNKNLAYYGGVAGTIPTTDDPDNARKFARILLAGPIASLIFAVVCISLAYAIGRPFGMIAFTTGLISVGIFFATTIPSRTGMLFTDRKRYQRLVTPGKDQEVELAMLRIIGQFSQDNSYKNVSPIDIEKMANDDIPFIRFFGHFNKVCWEIEQQSVASESTIQAYDLAAKDMPRSTVTAFAGEIEKYRTAVNNRE